MNGGEPNIDVRALSTGQLVAVLNSSPLGAVARESAVRSMRRRGGLKLSGKTVNLVHYMAICALEVYGSKEAIEADPFAAAAGSGDLPANDDGTLHLVHAAAWLHREAVR